MKTLKGLYRYNDNRLLYSAYHSRREVSMRFNFKIFQLRGTIMISNETFILIKS